MPKVPRNFSGEPLHPASSKSTRWKTEPFSSTPQASSRNGPSESHCRLGGSGGLGGPRGKKTLGSQVRSIGITRYCSGLKSASPHCPRLTGSCETFLGVHLPLL